MKPSMIILLLAMLMALFICLSATLGNGDDISFDEEEHSYELENDDIPHSESQETTLVGGTRHLLAKKTRTRHKMTCNKYPKVCHLKGSPGHNCCKKKCVNVKTDRINCGKCGKKCKYSEICCKGKCVDPRWDRKHCGSCNNKCAKGCSCSYGMCSYA